RVAADGLMLTLYMEWTGFSKDSCPYEVISGGTGFFSEDGCAKSLSVVYLVTEYSVECEWRGESGVANLRLMISFLPSDVYWCFLVHWRGSWRALLVLCLW
ncbi:hypothetical protein QTP70_020208, partial [Hemibagrus guttatus]